MKHIHTITKEDVGRHIIKLPCPTCGRVDTICCSDFIGYIMKIDIGKRIYRSEDGILCVENQEQLEERLNP